MNTVKLSHMKKKKRIGPRRYVELSGFHADVWQRFVLYNDPASTIMVFSPRVLHFLFTSFFLSTANVRYDLLSTRF